MVIKKNNILLKVVFLQFFIGSFNKNDSLQIFLEV